MSWTRIQGAANQSTAVNTITLSPITSGNFVIGYVSLSPGYALSSITDNKGNSYNIGLCSGDNKTVDTSDVLFYIFYSSTPITNAPTVWTFNNTNGTPSNFFTKIVEEFTAPAGTIAISQDGGFQQMQIRATTSLDPMQVFNNNVLVYSGCFTTGSLSAGAGFTAGTSVGSGVFEGTEYAVVSGPTTSTVTWVPGGNFWAIAAGLAPVSPTTWQMAQNISYSPANTVAVSSLTVPLPNSVAVGNVFAFNVICSSLSSVISVQDNLGNTYTPLLTNTARSLYWSGGLITQSGINTITITITSGPTAQLALYYTEWVPPPFTTTAFLDPSTGNPSVANGTGTGGNNFTPTITTINNGDLIFAIFEPEGVQGTNTVDGTSFLGTPDFSYNTGFKIQSAAGAVNTEWNSTTTGGTISWTMGIGVTQVFPPSGSGRFITEDEVRQSTADWLDAGKALSWFSRRAANMRWTD